MRNSMSTESSRVDCFNRLLTAAAVLREEALNEGRAPEPDESPGIYPQILTYLQHVERDFKKVEASQAASQRLKGRVASLETAQDRVAALETNLEKAQDKVTALEADLDKEKGRVSALETTVATLEKVHDRVAALEGRVKAVEDSHALLSRNMKEGVNRLKRSLFAGDIPSPLPAQSVDAAQGEILPLSPFEEEPHHQSPLPQFREAPVPNPPATTQPPVSRSATPASAKKRKVSDKDAKSDTVAVSYTDAKMKRQSKQFFAYLTQKGRANSRELQKEFDIDRDEVQAIIAYMQKRYTLQKEGKTNGTYWSLKA